MTEENATSNDLAADKNMLSDNRRKASYLTILAWTIEVILVTVGIGIAFAQASSGPEGSGFVQLFPVFGVFVVLAAVELAKIPAATVLFHAIGWRKLLPFVGLALASLISFETIFNGFERYAHVTSKPVLEANATLRALIGDKERLEASPSSDETDGSKVAALDEERVATQRKVVETYQTEVARTRSNLDSDETKKLKAQLANLVKQQDKAGEAADETWIQEQRWINERLKDDAIDAKMRNQLNRRMERMSPRLSVVSEARAKFDDQISKTNTAIEASIKAPSAEAMAILNAAEERLKSAREQLNKLQLEAADRSAKRVENQVDVTEAAKLRAVEIEVIKAGIVLQQKEVADKAQASQMHRWAAFVFGVEAVNVSDKQVKRTSAVFGLILGIVGALTGASVAMYAEWFRTRGIRPKVVEKEVPVEKLVEKVVDNIVEVEVPIIKYKYVPVPIGDDVDDLVEGILEALPAEAANELRSQLPKLNVRNFKIEEMTNARAA